ncbi:COP23 domain-containing protein [Phormidium nigroviride]
MGALGFLSRAASEITTWREKPEPLQQTLSIEENNFMPSKLLASHLWKILGLAAGSALLTTGSAFGYSLSIKNDLPVRVAAEPSDADATTTDPLDPTAEDDSANPDDDSKTATEPRFTCELDNGKSTVMYHPQSQPNQSYPWAIPSDLGGGWSSERRCGEISRRLESYRPDGLEELRTGVENGYSVICVTTEKNPDCRIVLTVPPGEDPKLTRDRVFQNLTVADSGQSTQGVNTFVDGNTGRIIERVLGVDSPRNRRNSQSDSIYLRPFLDRADGGTGTRLRGGLRSQPGPRLNPDNFRN